MRCWHEVLKKWDLTSGMSVCPTLCLQNNSSVASSNSNLVWGTQSSAGLKTSIAGPSCSLLRNSTSWVKLKYVIEYSAYFSWSVVGLRCVGTRSIWKARWGKTCKGKEFGLWFHSRGYHLLIVKHTDKGTICLRVFQTIKKSVGVVGWILSLSTCMLNSYGKYGCILRWGL